MEIKNGLWILGRGYLPLFNFISSLVIGGKISNLSSHWPMTILFHFPFQSGHMEGNLYWGVFCLGSPGTLFIHILQTIFLKIGFSYFPINRVFHSGCITFETQVQIRFWAENILNILIQWRYCQILNFFIEKEWHFRYISI